MTLVSRTLPHASITIPAPTTLVARILVAIAVKVETTNMRRATRKHLRDLPDHLLNDIGVTHHQAELERRKFFWKA